MAEQSKYFRGLDNLSDKATKDIEYDYAKVGKFDFQKQIERAEKILDNREQALERARERLGLQMAKETLSEKSLKDMNWSEVELLNEIRKEEKSDMENELNPPDIEGLREKVIATCNSLIPILQKKGISIAPLPEGSGLNNVLKFVSFVKEKLKENTQPSTTDDEQYLNDEIEFPPYQNQNEELTKKGLEFEIMTDMPVLDIKKGAVIEINPNGQWKKKKSDIWQCDGTGTCVFPLEE